MSSGKSSEFIAPNSRRAIEEAEVLGLEVVFPAVNQVQIDIDSDADYQVFAAHSEILLKFRSFTTKVETSRSGFPGKHITLSFPEELTNMERIALQATLGSDRKRELLSYFQEKMGDPHPTLFLEKKVVKEKTDEEFKQELRDYVHKTYGPLALVPLRSNPDGTVNREKTLLEPIFANFPKG